MLVQKITFTPVDKSLSTSRNNAKNTSSINVESLKYAKIDYSKLGIISFCGINPKKINIDLEKSKLLRQITELLQTEEPDLDTAELTMKVMRRVMNFFRESMKRQTKILEEAEKLADNKVLNPQQKLEEIQKLQKKLTQTSKFKYNPDGPKNKKQVAENIDYQLLNKLKSAVVEDDFNLGRVLTDYYSGLKNITKIEDLKKQYPKIKTPTSPQEVIANKIESVLTRDFYEGLADNMDSVEEASEYCVKPVGSLVYDIAMKHKVDPIKLFDAVFPHTAVRIFERYEKVATSGMSSIPEVRKVKTPQVSDLDLKLLNVDFDDFVTSTVRKHYLEDQKLNEITYEKDGVSLPLSDLRGSEYKFEKMPEKVRSFVKTGETLDYAQKDYDNFEMNQFKARLDFFANAELSENEEILSKIIDFDSCDFTPEDMKFLSRFLRELDSVREGKKSMAEAVESIKEQDLAPNGTNKLNEIARQKAEEDIKIKQKVTAELKGIKRDFDNAMNILYQNNLADLANSCADYRPKSIDSCEDAKYLISLINKNIDNDAKVLNRKSVEQSVMRWDTYNLYKKSGKASDKALAKAEAFAMKTDGTIDIDKAGQYLLNSQVVKMYPESAKYSEYPEVLDKVIEKTASQDEAVRYLCKYEDYANLSQENKAQLSNFMDLFDQKNSVDKAILKTIIEQDYLNVDTPVQIKTAGAEPITATFSAKAKKAIADKYKYPICVSYLRGFEDALNNFAREWGSSGIKKTGKNNNTLRYKMELKIAGENDRLFSSNNDYYFDVFSDKGFH